MNPFILGIPPRQSPRSRSRTASNLPTKWSSTTLLTSNMQNGPSSVQNLSPISLMQNGTTFCQGNQLISTQYSPEAYPLQPTTELSKLLENSNFSSEQPNLPKRLKLMETGSPHGDQLLAQPDSLSLTGNENSMRTGITSLAISQQPIQNFTRRSLNSTNLSENSLALSTTPSSWTFKNSDIWRHATSSLGVSLPTQALNQKRKQPPSLSGAAANLVAIGTKVLATSRLPNANTGMSASSVEGSIERENVTAKQ